MADKEFKPDPMPGDLHSYRELLWFNVEYIKFHMGEINGQVAKNKKDIGVIKTDVKVAKALGRASATIIVLGGIVITALVALGVF